jgi:hypothetical protein
MKRPSRLLLTFACGVSLLVCVVAWVRGYLPEYFTLRSHEGSLYLIFYGRDQAPFINPANNPSLRPVSADPRVPAYPPGRWDTEQILADARKLKPPQITVTRWRWAGFELIATDNKLAWNYFVLAIPFWSLCLPLGVATAWGWSTARRPESRRARGQCTACGYDLRATPDRCPECGTVPSAE